MPKYFRRKKHRAVTLLLSLWVVVALSLLAHSLAFEMIVETRLTTTYRDQFLAEQIARVGVARAVADLRNDDMLGEEESGWNTRFDAIGDVWNGGSLVPREFEVTPVDGRDPSGYYQLLVVDEESKLDLNGRQEGWRNIMKNLLILLDVDEEEAEDMANIIWDWKDPDDIPCGGEGQSEIEFYTEMLGDMDYFGEGADQRLYYPKNYDFDTVEELLQIPGMTMEVFYGYDPYEDEMAADEIPFFPPLDRNPRRKPGLRDLLTVQANRLNPNTANFWVLAACLAEVTGDLDTAEGLAESFIDHRQGSGDTDLDNSRAFRTFDEMSQVSGLSPPVLSKFRQMVPLTLRSSSFSIYCEARAGKESRRARTSRSRREDKPRPRVRVLARCTRDLINYQGTDLEEWLPPGIRTQDRETRTGDIFTAWAVPVIYFSSWNVY